MQLRYTVDLIRIPNPKQKLTGCARTHSRSMSSPRWPWRGDCRRSETPIRERNDGDEVEASSIFTSAGTGNKTRCTYVDASRYGIRVRSPLGLNWGGVCWTFSVTVLLTIREGQIEMAGVLRWRWNYADWLIFLLRSILVEIWGYLECNRNILVINHYWFSTYKICY